jgi:hypothetical protein
MKPYMVKRAHGLLAKMRSSDHWTREYDACEYSPGEYHLTRAVDIGPKTIELLKAMGEIEEIKPHVYRLINDDLGDLWVD